VLRDETTMYSGNLSMRSLADVVSASDFSGTNDSEYLETILVAVPKCVTSSSWRLLCLYWPTCLLTCRNITKEWEASYERLTQMVVPRSSTYVGSTFSILCTRWLIVETHTGNSRKMKNTFFTRWRFSDESRTNSRKERERRSERPRSPPSLIW